MKGTEYREQREGEREKKEGSLKDQAFSNGVFTPKSTENVAMGCGFVVMGCGFVVMGLRLKKTPSEYEWTDLPFQKENRRKKSNKKGKK